MDTAIWMLQVFLAVIFMMAGLFKIAPPKEELGIIMPWAKYFSPTFFKMIGVLEVLGAAGLILPMALDILPWLTTASAIALTVEMVLAIRTHLMKKKKAELAMDSFLAVIAIMIATYRIISS